jgi:hypothetical protein
VFLPALVHNWWRQEAALDLSTPWLAALQDRIESFFDRAPWKTPVAALGRAPLSPDRCRMALGGAGSHLSDAEVVSLRDQMYALAAPLLDLVLAEDSRCAD